MIPWLIIMFFRVMMLMIYRVCQDLPYCGRWIASYYSPCVPSKPTEEWTAAGANFPDGRLISSDDQVDIYSIRAKDAWVEQTVTTAIQARIDLEKQNGSSHYHYFRNKDCQEAYARYENIICLSTFDILVSYELFQHRRYTCWLSFPRCSDEFDESLPMCQSGEYSMLRMNM